jgi:ABC-type transport system involved in cytochrome c biogenesis permease subunit
MMKQKSVNDIFKFIWLIMSIVCALIGLQQTANVGIKQSYMFFIMAAFSFGMYLLRKQMGKRIQNKNE